MRHLCVHGHFYQPARENPWTGVVELNDAAAPYHDWNARITAQCYARNAASRILDGADRVIRIVNNFTGISFDVGPTLLRWLAAGAPSTYELILEADRTSRHEQYGHGGALAQVYNHVIMPLATPRDRVTQVRWGVRDFERRFRRRPEGMWLAETAVDLPTLEILADEGIGFTILAPHQARRVRRPDGAWMDVTEATLDVAVPYRCRLPSGRTIALFFYQGPLSRAVAFEGLLHDGGDFADRLAGALPPEGTPPRLLLVASDGETYGHHHEFGDMALAFALDRLSHDDGIRLTNCAAFLAAHPPAAEVEIAEHTSWSCAHGVERWRSDCGCRTKDGTQQRWRAPLRAAIQWLVDELGNLFERRGSEVFRDPWAARDEAVDLIDAPAGTAEGFLRRHGVGDDGTRMRAARTLLEMARQALLMQSSDGWFFDDVAGGETVQILSHAARAIGLAGDAAPDLEEGLLGFLRRAPGNTERFPDGAAVYDALVRPRMTFPRNAAAIYAMTALFETPSATLSGELTVSPADRGAAVAGGHTLAVGRARVRHAVTGAESDVVYAAAHFGGHEVHCAVAEGWPEDRYAEVRTSLLSRLGRDVLSEILRTIDQNFGPRAYTLNDLPVEDRRAVLEHIARPALEALESVYRKVYQENRPLMEYLRTAAAPVPPAFVTAAVVAITGEMERVLASEPKTPLPEGARTLLGELQLWGRELHAARFEPYLRSRLERVLTGTQRPAERARRALMILAFARDAGITINLWEAQNLFARGMYASAPGDAAVRELAEALRFRLDHAAAHGG
jgi:alpha-amylase/alpha-mannosidase (GH57 family)